ncbi:AAA family ATPase [Altererythrobacter sp.]|uniref:AAA family ATPase n=2 Tax=Altererythrobacter sp. TaxID=1872480 RepID=UPI001B1DF75F|nr:AAA family ATPase [Altererythrobacter sp.]MBO6608739.1 AAA family ATPase [Altererythrobacter sp.]MBO6642994.1 AAA family ATPase [Altererythrobacter sp.]
MSKMDNIKSSAGELTADLPRGVMVVAQPGTLSGLAGLSSQVNAIACGIEDKLPIADLAAASVVVIEVDPASRNSLERVDMLREQLPSIKVIAGLADVDIATSRTLLRRGVSDIVALPFSLDELVTSIVDTAQQIEPEVESERKLAPFITVIKSIGGVGSTTVATHLAAQMAHDLGEGHRACIIDLDLQAGDVSQYLGASSRQSLMDLIEAGDRLDSELLRSVATEGHDLIDVIAPPADIVPIESIDFKQLMRVINLARREYDVVLIDLPASFTNWSLSTVYAADVSILVGMLTIPSLRHAKRQLDFLVSMGISKDSIHVVLNQVEKKLFKSIDASDAEKALKHPVLATLSEEESLLREAQDQGQLIYAVQKRSKFSKDIMKLSDLVAERLAEAE